MKKSYLLTGAALLLGASNIFAQASAKQTSSTFLFPEFTSGTVFQKNGATLDATLDYNTVTQEMMFAQEGKNLILNDVSNIDSVVINGVVLVPARNVFFEKLTKTPIALYAQYKGKIVQGDPLGGRIGTSNSTLNGQLNGRKANNDKPGNYDLKLADGYTMDVQTIYWLKKGNEYTQVSTLKAFTKQFPGKEAQIDAFVKENNISIVKIQDMIRLTEFVNK
ncbi:hypothetical protein ACFQZI_15770 [Mucilaginibacter lutimaris]|uniref:Uncharacterized protein n=1 Tax=Mucilaginibacter lutimaris TaxID=931629 RepID=A0ABW2ZJF9_9SPHI